MKKIISMLVFLVSCSQNNKYQEELFFTPVPLTRPLIEEYMSVLPNVLAKAKDFQAIEQVRNLDEKAYNKMFYEFLYRDKSLESALRDLGFTNAATFGDFHYSVLEAYLIVLQQPKMFQEALIAIPNIKGELDKALLRQAREKNNSELDARIKIMRENLDFYNNIVLIEQFKDRIQQIDA